jgi:hypothetical protein
LLGQREIRARLAELQRATEQKTVVTTELLLRRAEEILDAAFKAGQFSASTAALKELGILSGKRVERQEVGQPGEFENLSDQEFVARVREKLAAAQRVVDADFVVVDDGAED